MIAKRVLPAVVFLLMILSNLAQAQCPGGSGAECVTSFFNQSRIDHR